LIQNVIKSNYLYNKSSNFVNDVFKKFRPDVVFHLAEQPSAPYSIIDQKHCLFSTKQYQKNF